MDLVGANKIKTGYLTAHHHQFPFPDGCYIWDAVSRRRYTSDWSTKTRLNEHQFIIRVVYFGATKGQSSRALFWSASMKKMKKMKKMADTGGAKKMMRPRRAPRLPRFAVGFGPRRPSQRLGDLFPLGADLDADCLTGTA